MPGVVHLDLLRAKKIAEPYYRYGELELAWVYLEPSWTFSRTIAAGALGANPGPSYSRHYHDLGMFSQAPSQTRMRYCAC